LKRSWLKPGRSEAVKTSRKVAVTVTEGIGSWSAGGYYIAVGYSTSVESLGAEKEKGIEEKLAEEDAKARRGREAALRKDPQFDEES
jgi:hypothetical protein